MSILNSNGPGVKDGHRKFDDGPHTRTDRASSPSRSRCGWRLWRPSAAQSLLLAAALLLPSSALQAGVDLLQSARQENVFTADFVQSLASEPTAALNEIRDEDGRTMLHWLASRSHQARMLALLLYKADVNVKDHHGRTPLFDCLEAHDPFWGGDSDYMILEMLTTRGADLNARSDDGMTPLALAVKKGDHRKAAFLIEHGAALAPEGVSPEMLPTAIAKAKDDQRMVALLESAKKGNIDADQSETPLTAESKSAALTAANLPAVKKMIASGWDINERDEKGRTALYRAVEEKRADLASLLLFSGADPNIATDTGTTPLMASVRVLTIEGQRMMAMLLFKGANIHAVTKKGATALTTAVASGHDIGVLALIAAGASPFEVTPKGSLMAYAEHPPTAYLLKQFRLTPIQKKLGADPVAIMFEAAKRGNFEAVEKALDSGLKPDTQYDVERTMMDWVALGGNFEMVDLLLKRGADINHQHPSDGLHLLHMLASWGSSGASSPKVGAAYIEKLIARGANPNIAMKDGTTPLMIAAREGAVGPVTAALLQGGAEINVRNAAGLTALGVARKYGRTEMAEYLQSHGGKD